MAYLRPSLIEAGWCGTKAALLIGWLWCRTMIQNLARGSFSMADSYRDCNLSECLSSDVHAFEINFLLLPVAASFSPTKQTVDTSFIVSSCTGRCPGPGRDHAVLAQALEANPP